MKDKINNKEDKQKEKEEKESFWRPCMHNGIEYQVGSQVCMNGQVYECSIEGMWFPTGGTC